jgi:hypothetical protein
MKLELRATQEHAKKRVHLDERFVGSFFADSLMARLIFLRIETLKARIIIIGSTPEAELLCILTGACLALKQAKFPSPGRSTI